MGGTIADDYDVGEVIELDGERATVAWEWSMTQTAASLSDLAPFDAATAERWEAEIEAAR